MTVLEQWEEALGQAVSHHFSPSGHALAVCPSRLVSGQILQALEIHFADDRDPVIVEHDSMINLLDWASGTEFVYRVVGEPLGKLPYNALWVFSLETGMSSQILVESDYGVYVSSAAQTGRPGHLSVLSKPEDEPGLFDFNVRAGTMTRLDRFDAALRNLEVYPLFGHSWSEAQQEVALIAWRREDYLESDDNEILDAQRKPHHEAKYRKPHCLFILSATGSYWEVPGTIRAHNPRWTPDSSLIVYQEYMDQGEKGNNGLWLSRRDSFALRRLGTCPSFTPMLMHPSGVLVAEMEAPWFPIDESLPPRTRLTPWCWRGFRLQDGEVSPL